MPPLLYRDRSGHEDQLLGPPVEERQLPGAGGITRREELDLETQLAELAGEGAATTPVAGEAGAAGEPLHQPLEGAAGRARRRELVARDQVEDEDPGSVGEQRAHPPPEVALSV